MRLSYSQTFPELEIVTYLRAQMMSHKELKLH